MTIDGIRFVIDSGKHREMDEDNTLSGDFRKLVEKWISQAQANQRKGRAGRTGPGTCYRLYSEKFFNEALDEFSTPELRRTSLESVFLSAMSLGHDV